MDINAEQLKMVLDMLQSAGENGKQMFILWVIIHYGTKLVVGLIIAGIGALGLRVVVRIFSAHGHLEMLRDTALPGKFVGTITDHEYHCTLTRIGQLVAAEKEWKKSQSEPKVGSERNCYQDKA